MNNDESFSVCWKWWPSDLVYIWLSHAFTEARDSGPAFVVGSAVWHRREWSQSRGVQHSETERDERVESHFTFHIYVALLECNGHGTYSFPAVWSTPCCSLSDTALNFSPGSFFASEMRFDIFEITFRYMIIMITFEIFWDLKLRYPGYWIILVWRYDISFLSVWY